MRWKVAAAALAGFFLLALPVAAARAQGDARAQAEAGIRSYELALETRDRGARLNGFRDAERFFRSAADSPNATAALQVNLGNASLAGERLGPAVLAYRRARALDPTYPQAEQNLVHARSLLPAWVPRPAAETRLGDLPFVGVGWSLGIGSVRVAALFALGALFLAAGLRFQKSGLYVIAGLLGAAWLALGLFAVFFPQGAGADAAVITADEVTARSADSQLSPVAFSRPLPGGTEVQILEDRSPWLRVRVGGDRDVWVLGSSLSRVEKSGR